MRSKLTIFGTALAQVLFVTLSTVFIANSLFVHALFSSFMISLIWTFNVKRIAFSTITERFIYALGATTGTAIGYSIGNIFL